MTKANIDKWRAILAKLHSTSKSRVAALFQQVDSNGDGYLTHDELQRAVDQSGLMLSPQESRDMAAYLDEHGNNRIDYSPFIPGLQSAAPADPAKEASFAQPSTSVPKHPSSTSLLASNAPIKPSSANTTSAPTAPPDSADMLTANTKTPAVKVWKIKLVRLRAYYCFFLAGIDVGT